MSSGPVARAALLSKAEAYILEHGLLDLTLTALAEGIGSNRRMLLYHFSSLDDLVREAVGDIVGRLELTKRLTQILSGQGDLVERFDNAWAHLADPAQEPWHRIYFAHMGLAAEDPARYEAFLKQSREGWPALLESVIRSAGFSPSEGRARAISALWSGLELALLSGQPRESLADTHHFAVTAILSAS